MTPSRQLNHLGGSRENSNSSVCKNSVQGRTLIADNRGIVCTRKAFDQETGCCSVRNLTQELESHSRACRDATPIECDGKSECCVHFEHCVSCCTLLQEDSRLELLATSFVGKFKGTTERFQICQMACRTSSKSVIHENAFRSNFKHCFGQSPPPLLAKMPNQKQLELGK